MAMAGGGASRYAKRGWSTRKLVAGNLRAFPASDAADSRSSPSRQLGRYGPGGLKRGPLRCDTAGGSEQLQCVDRQGDVVDAKDLHAAAGQGERDAEGAGVAIACLIAENFSDESFARVPDQDWP